MSTTQTLILGAIAGFTIYIGLPMGRVRSARHEVSASLSSVATGILVFLFWDVTTHGVDPVDVRLEAHQWGSFTWYAVLLGGGFTLGLMSLVYYDRWLQKARTVTLGRGSRLAALTPGRRLAVLIATGIGLHNFGEGLAIGQSAAAGEVSLALVLIIGFGLHNATEGFGIVGPMSREEERPSWAFLGWMGLIGGGPTFLGTLIGQSWVSPALETVFFALAGGSILYVVIQLFDVCRRFQMPILVAWMVLLGLLLGFGTDFILTGAGA